MSTTLLRPSAFLVLLAPLAAQGTRAASLAPEAILPASTYAAARFGGLAACRDAAAAMPAAGAVQTFLQKLPADVRAEHLDRELDEASRELQRECEHIGLRPSDVRGALARPMAIGMGRLSIEGFGPSVALVIDAGDQRRSINRLVQWGSQRIAEAAGGAETGEVEIGGRTFHSMQLNFGLSLFAGAVDNLYVITNSRGYLREMLDVAAGKQPPLAKDSRLGQLSGLLPAPALASLFVNAQRLTAMWGPHLPYETAEWCDALGIGGIDAIYWAYAAGAAGGTDLLHVGLGGSEHGLCKALLAAPADLSFANACSANTVLFASGSLDVDGMLTAFDKVADKLPEAWRKALMRAVQRELGRGLRHAGTTAENVHALVKAFGSQIGVALALEKGAVPKPELLVRVAVRDAETVGALMKQLEAQVGKAGLEWKTRKAGENELRFCNVQIEEASLQLSPCYVLTKDALWLGSDTAALLRAMRLAGGGGQDGLAAQQDFQDLAKAVAGASGVVHWRLFRAAELGWRSIETLAYPMLDAHKEEIGFGSDALPDAETMAKALGTCTMTWRVDDDGVSVKSDGTFTFGAMLAALGLVGDEVLSRAGNKVY